MALQDPHASSPEIDPALLGRFGLTGPRYTSYPTADRFAAPYGSAEHAERLARRHIGAMRPPLSLYLHIPFCESVCYYCGCNKVVTRDRSRAERYLGYLEREIDLACAHLGTERTVSQIHFGGGTPTYLADGQIESLMHRLRERFAFTEDIESSIELDPRTAPPERVRFLASLGFNRASLGVQDFDPAVQQAVHRIQPEAMTLATLEAARASGFRSINFDLIYGLPRQTVATFSRTLERVIDARPERVALYNYAHLPERFKPQRRIDAAELPDAPTRLSIFLAALEVLTGAGYVYIGLDHFARPDDELAIAQRTGRLHRNFQGYSTRADCDLVALGVSAISRVGPTYAQNVRTLEAYYARLDAGELPVERGYVLDRDDLARRAIIMALMCHGEVSIESIELAYLVDFRRYFETEWRELEHLRSLGLLELERDWIGVTAKGRFFVRVAAMIFDRHLRESRRVAELAGAEAGGARYSKVV